MEQLNNTIQNCNQIELMDHGDYELEKEEQEEINCDDKWLVSQVLGGARVQDHSSNSRPNQQK